MDLTATWDDIQDYVYVKYDDIIIRVSHINGHTFYGLVIKGSGIFSPKDIWEGSKRLVDIGYYILLPKLKQSPTAKWLLDNNGKTTNNT